MNETLVYDAARDAAHGLSLNTIATILMVGGFALLAVPTVMTMRRKPEKRTRGFVSLGVMGLIAVGVLFGLPMLDRPPTDADTQMIVGVIGSVTPKLFSVGGIKVMISCADTSHCPGVANGDMARVAIVDDSGPETDALAVRIWKRSGAQAPK